MPRKLKQIVEEVIEINEEIIDEPITNQMVIKNKPKRKYKKRVKKEEPVEEKKEPTQEPKKPELVMRFLLQKDYDERMDYMRKKLVKPGLSLKKRKSYMAYVNKLKTKYQVIQI